MSNVGTEAATPQDASLITFSVSVNGLFLVLGAGLILRLLLALLPGFAIDLGTFSAWSGTLAADGPWNFYKSDFFTDYAPGYMYVLFALGKLRQWFHFSGSEFEYILKLPSIAADLGSAYLLYRLLAGRREDVRLGAAALYLLFPATLLIGPIWGQVDSLLALFLLLSVYFIGRDRPIAGALAFTVGFLIKPQAIAALPFLAFWIMREHPPKLREVRPGLRLPLPPTLWYQIIGAALAVTFVIIFPFFPSWKPWQPFVDLIDQLNSATNVYRVNSFWAYNFWTVFGLMKKGGGFWPDTGVDHGKQAQQFLSLDTRVWGLVLFALCVGLIIYTLRKGRGTGFLALGTALCVLAFYTFVTRMHERYVFAFFLPFLAACALIHSRALWALFAGLGLLHFMNLYHVYVYYYPDHVLKIDGVYNWLANADFWGSGLETVQVLSAGVLAGLALTLTAGYRLANRRPQTEGT